MSVDFEENISSSDATYKQHATWLLNINMDNTTRVLNIAL